MSSRPTLLAAAAAALTLFAALPATGQASPQNDAVFRAYAEQVIPNGHVQVIQGTRTADGECQTNFQLPTEHRGDGPQAAVEVAQDSATCSQTYVIGTPASAVGPILEPAAAPGSHSESTSVTEQAQAGAATARVRTTHKTPRAHAASSYAKAYFLTVIKFNSNGVPQTQAWVQTTVQWHYDGSCVVSPTPTGGASDEWWEPWGLGYSDFPSGWECSRTWFARGFEIGNRYNSCGSGNAWIHVMRNTIDAYANGSFTPYDGDSWCDNAIALYNVDYWNYY